MVIFDAATVLIPDKICIFSTSNVSVPDWSFRPHFLFQLGNILPVKSIGPVLNRLRA